MSDVSHRPFSLVCFTLTTLSYADFKNPNDPHDGSFDPHPTDYPVSELEFPNSGASEWYVSPIFFLLPHVHGIWRYPFLSPPPLSWYFMRTPLCNTSFVPFAALKHDQSHPQQSFDDSCAPVSTSFLL